MSHFTIAKIYMQRSILQNIYLKSQAPLSMGFSRQEYWSMMALFFPNVLYIELHKRIMKTYTIGIYLTVNLIKSIIIIT